MTQANDAILVTPGSGATVATHLINGKEYQVVMQAGPSGHILDSMETYIATADAVANAANKQMLSLFNGVGSAKVVKLRKLFYVQNQTAAVAGAATRVEVKRTTAQSVGTAVTPRPFDTTNAALPAQVLCATGATVTEDVLLFPFVTSSEEQVAAGTLTIQALMGLFNLLPEGSHIQDFVLREGQGVTIKNITTTVGTFTPILVFTLE
jgi:hypothetical protein